MMIAGDKLTKCCLYFYEKIISQILVALPNDIDYLWDLQ
jgi:hypothetical protein